jgi:thiamine biosynthesis lipoprotein
MILGGLAMGLVPRMAWAATPVVGGAAFGSTWRLVSDMPNADAAMPLVAGRVAAVDAAMSPYRAGSILSRFNRAAPGEAVDLPPGMARVVSAALDVARRTNSAFDPTVGPLVRRFGFGPITGDSSGGIDSVVMTDSALRKTDQGATLDLCGIAKGYALDDLTEVLIAQGAGDFLLELGGEVRAVGHHPSGRAWRVGIEDPFAPHLQARYVVVPGDLALATSGHSANGLIAPIATSHVIDPARARPATGFAGSVSVLAPDGMTADALATALLAMGADGPDFARRADIAALFVLGPADADASILTGDFAAHVLT